MSIGSARGSKLQIKPEDQKKNKQHGVFPRFCGVLRAQIFGLRARPDFDLLARSELLRFSIFWLDLLCFDSLAEYAFFF